jgi:penicillin-binding protein 2
VVRPHLGQAVEDGSGRLVQQLRMRPRRQVEFAKANQQAIMDGLRGAASEEGGTSADVFRGFPKDLPVYGKTGTAERPGHGDQSWYVCFVPNASKPIVLAVTVEDGGFGAEAAAPVARVMLAQWFNQKKTFIAGKSRTN